MILEAELWGMTSRLNAERHGLDKDTQFRLLREVEELRAALRDVKEDWKQGAFLTRVTLAKVDAALGEE